MVRPEQGRNHLLFAFAGRLLFWGRQRSRAAVRNMERVGIPRATLGGQTLRLFIESSVRLRRLLPDKHQAALSPGASPGSVFCGESALAIDKTCQRVGRRNC